MKIKNTDPELEAIIAALKPLYVKLFQQESGDPKYNAQRNLSGRTHYVDDDTLRFHHSRINGGGHAAKGLLFVVVESCSLDMRNTERGHRCCVFDVFGTAVYRPNLDECTKSSDAARKAMDTVEFDLVAHYRTTLEGRLKHAEDEATKLLKAVQDLVATEVITEVVAERK